MSEQPDLRRELLRGLRGGNGANYAGSDRANATRIVALLWLLSAVLAIAFLPFDPPTEAIGGGGVGARRRDHRRQPGRREAPAARRPLGFNELLALSYLGLAQVAVLVWLGGGAGSAYENLYLLWVGAGTGIHPPRRALAYSPRQGSPYGCRSYTTTRPAPRSRRWRPATCCWSRSGSSFSR